MAFLRRFGTPNVEKMKVKRDTKGLIRALSYPKDASVEKDSADALGEIGDAKAVEPLIAAAEKGNAHAVIALGKIADPRAVPPLISALEDKTWDVPVHRLCFALGEIGDQRAVEPLVGFLKRTQEEGAATALDRLGWKPTQDDLGVAYYIAKREWGECVRIGGSAVDYLITALQEAVEMLARTPKPRVVKTMYTAGAYKAREDAEKKVYGIVDTLGEIGDARAVEPLVTALVEMEGETEREAAAEALGKIGEPQAVEPLVRVLSEVNSECVCGAAAKALGRIRGDGVERLIGVLQEAKSPYALGAVATALKHIGDARAVEPLIEAVREPSEVSFAASDIAIALGELGDRRAVEPLIALLRTGCGRDAAIALKRIGWQPDKSEAGAAYWIAMGKHPKCVEIGPPAVEPLIDSLIHGSATEGLIIGVATTLGWIGDTRAVEPLKKLLTHRAYSYRKAAADALKEITGEDFSESIKP